MIRIEAIWYNIAAAHQNDRGKEYVDYEIQWQIRECIQEFQRCLPESSKWINQIRIEIAPEMNRRKYLTDLTRELHAEPKEYLENTLGEVFHGEKGYAIVIYPERIRWMTEMRFMICHELGHVHSSIINYDVESECLRDARQQNDTPMRSGGAVWLEFIADVIAYKVTGERFVGFELCDLQKYMIYLFDNAFAQGYVTPAEIGHFAAFVLMNPKLRRRFMHNKNRLPELSDYPVEIVSIISELLDLLNEQIQEEDYVRISRDRMLCFGELIDELWDACSVL